ncbi:MAG: DNA-3-methyladenine glycosylase 2 family protein [Acidobacteria bacterium]|nr:DNA-3-methyladenine glycosylase 2 family protein [Acidobacteriota bacterium]
MKDREIKKFFENDKILGKIAKSRPLPTLDIYGKRGPFLSLVEAIISQQLSGKAASAIYQKFEKLLTNKKDFAKFLAQIEKERLLEVGISKSKADCINEISKMIYKKNINIEKLLKAPEEEIRETLIKVKGIGAWTVDMFLMFGLKREDIWPFTDYGIRKNLSKILKKENILTLEEAKNFGDKWKPYRSYASCYIWNI